MDLTGSGVLILVDLRQTNNQVEPSPVDCSGSWLKERLESVCASKRWQLLMIGSVLAQHVGHVTLKAMCDSSLIGLLHSPSTVICYQAAMLRCCAVIIPHYTLMKSRNPICLHMNPGNCMFFWISIPLSEWFLQSSANWALKHVKRMSDSDSWCHSYSNAFSCHQRIITRNHVQLPVCVICRTSRKWHECFYCGFYEEKHHDSVSVNNTFRS